MGSDVSVHLPPAAPILLFYYYLPSKIDPLRRLVKYTCAGACLSWMHSEATKYRRFSPLPGMQGANVRKGPRVPFLPEQERGSEAAAPAGAAARGEERDGDEGGDGGAAGRAGAGARGSGRLRKDATSAARDDGAGEPAHHPWDPFQSFGTISSAYRTWLEGANLRNKRARQLRRRRAQDALLALQQPSAAGGAGNSSLTEAAADGDVGYALVTGASTGIGRALAVELARYRIPLILVARDVVKLSEVAREIEKYYGIPCRVLGADLGRGDAARRIHEATAAAGLKVDILINNAGVCSHGNFVDTADDEDYVATTMQVNINSATELCRLYGKDMKERRRGRIMFVSSMSGALPGCPSVAV